MLAIGVDIIEIARIERSMERLGTRFLDRIFTENERDHCENQAGRLAGRFAVKEAVGKALGTGIGDVRWKDIEVMNDDRGRPYLVLHHAASDLADSLGFSDWAISLSHTKTHAVGMAVATNGGGP